ncbi:arylsulfatase [Candidatus Zixiibacteriota bacterium]
MSESLERRDFIRRVGLGTAALVAAPLSSCTRSSHFRPNIIFIVADDLGYAELGSYGQRKIRTPNLDRIAAEGMRFTQHYSGSPVCAPSRCVLLTGKHTGHSYIRANDEMSERGDVWRDPALEGQRPLPADTVTIGTLLQQEGYVTGAIGKWGLGGPGSTGEPNNQGFDHWYGYLCQRVAHNYYPTHLWRNREKDILEGNEYFYPHQRLPADRDPHDPDSYREYAGNDYSMDSMMTEALWFIRENQETPFFLYLPFPVPHASLQVPEDSLEEYQGAFPETPYTGEKSYLPHPTPRAAYAAMITRMDRGIGDIMSLLKELGLDENTLVVFTSDNGPTFNGGTDSNFFESAGELRGLKVSLQEGGIRVPMIARWPGMIEPGTVSDHISAFHDWMPTLLDVVGGGIPAGIDGLSLLPTLRGTPRRQKKHDYLYWEHNGQQAVRLDDWKAFRKSTGDEIELYNLGGDIGEAMNIAADHPAVMVRINEIMLDGRTRSELFPLTR